MLKDVKYILFDLDGTLIDSSEGVVIATNYALMKYGFIARDPEEIKKYIGYPLDVMFPAFCDGPVNKLKAAFQERGRGLIVDESKALPGVTDTLKRLNELGYIMGIATTKYSYHSEAIVERLGWSEHFRALASGDEVENVKPAPDLIELIVQKLGAEKSKSVMVGDTVNDIIAARAAGLRTVAVHSPFGNDDLSKEDPDYEIDNLPQLLEILSRN